MAIIKTTGLGTLKDSLLFDSTSNGIHLGVTSATASNLLDDYEEGTWTPVLEGRTTAGTVSYLIQKGYYTKIGDVVHIQLNVFVTSSSSGSGELQISGLPFVCIGERGYSPVSLYAPSDLIHSNNTAYIQQTETNIRFGVDVSVVANNDEIRIAGTYKT